MRLRNKIALLSATSAFIPILIVVIIVLIQKGSTANSIGKEVDLLARNNLKTSVTSVYNLCSVTDNMISKILQNNLYNLEDAIKTNNGLNLASSMIEWEAKNQENSNLEKIILPKFNLGSTWLGQNKDKNIETILVDKMGRRDNCKITIFQRINSNGDMLRVATNILTKDGKRAIGTYIPAIKSDGSKNPVINAVLNGKEYKGTALVVDRYYQTVYQPIRDKSNKIIGMIFVGICPENIPEFRNIVLNMIIGKTGYAYIINGDGLRKGCYVISKGGKRDYENIWNSKDADGKLFIQDIITKSIGLENGDCAFVNYPWKNPGDVTAKQKIAAVTYYKPFDWVIGTGTFEEEFKESENIVFSEMNYLTYSIILVGVIVDLIMIAITLYYGSKISKPIVRATQVAQEIANGNFNL